MDIKIGVQDTAREISLESAQTQDEVLAAVAAAVQAGGLLSLTDDKGRTVIIPAAKLAYVEIGAPSSRKVGFSSSS